MGVLMALFGGLCTCDSLQSLNLLHASPAGVDAAGHQVRDSSARGRDSSLQSLAHSIPPIKGSCWRVGPVAVQGSCWRLGPVTWWTGRRLLSTEEASLPKQIL